MPASLTRPIVLLVEDSDDDVFFFRRALKRTKSAPTLHHVTDGRAAIAYLEKAHASPADPEHPWPDLVFLDLKLPTFSGFEILAWIRTQTFAPTLNIEVLSGSQQKSDIDRALSLGASAYSVKPVTSDYLEHRVQSWLEQRPGTRSSSAA